MIIDKSRFVDVNGRPITQSLFLDITYNDLCVYTFRDQDAEWNGKIYPSLKRLYLEEEDPTEYEFATKHLLNYRHWKRICQNQQVLKHVQEWREELEAKLRCKAVKHMLTAAQTGNYQAAKWFADRGWTNNGAGRPSKADIESEKQFQVRIDKEYGADVVRLFGNGGVPQ
jgi:hypothetical protein